MELNDVVDECTNILESPGKRLTELVSVEWMDGSCTSELSSSRTNSSLPVSIRLDYYSFDVCIAISLLFDE